MHKSTLVAMAALLAAPAAAAQDVPLFGAPRIVRIGEGTHGLLAGDFDGDGRGDLALVDNGHARIEVLLHREPGAGKPPPAPERNVPADDPLFERRHVLTERRVGGCVTGDFDGDGRPDLAWYGEPRALVIAHQDESGLFGRRREIRIDDGSLNPRALAAGDLDGDGKDDLVLLAAQDVVLLIQGKEGLGDPRRVPAVLADQGWVKIADVDGDGRADLVLADNNQREPLRFRRLGKEGDLGPEIALECPVIRSLVPLGKEDPGSLLLIPQASGTLRRVRIERNEDADGPAAIGRPRLHPFGGKEGDGDLAVGDVDGDGRADVVVADGAGARLLLYAQAAGTGLGAARPFPCYRGASGTTLADLDGDGRAEVLVMSAEEKCLGALRFDGQRLGFPETLVSEDALQAFAAGDLDGDGRPDLAVAAGKGKARRLLVRFGGEGGDAAIDLPAEIEVAAMRCGDLDGDGRPEILVCDRFAPPVVVACRPGRQLERLDPAVLFRATTPRNLVLGALGFVRLGDDERPAWLYATGNVVRAARIEAGALKIADQVSAPPGARIAGAAVLDLDGDGDGEIAVLDAAAKGVRIMKRDDAGVFAESRTADAGDLELRGLHAADLDGDGRTDLLVAGRREFGVLLAGAAPEELAHGEPYESPERDAYLTLVASADLRGTPKPEVVAVDGGNKRLEILAWEEERLVRLHSWRIFEEKSFEGVRRDLGEPRDLLLTDVTGDGRKDIVLLVHDRVLVYPRE